MKCAYCLRNNYRKPADLDEIEDAVTVSDGDAMCLYHWLSSLLRRGHAP